MIPDGFGGLARADLGARGELTETIAILIPADAVATFRRLGRSRSA